MTDSRPTNPAPPPVFDQEELLGKILDELKGLRLDVGDFRAMVAGVVESQIKILTRLEHAEVQLATLQSIIDLLPCKPRLGACFREVE